MESLDAYREKRAQETQAISDLSDMYGDKVSELARLVPFIDMQLAKIRDGEMPSSLATQLFNSLQFRANKIKALFLRNPVLLSKASKDLYEFNKTKNEVAKSVKSINQQKLKLVSLKKRIQLELEKEKPHLEKIRQKFYEAVRAENKQESRILAPFTAFARKIIYIKDCWNYYHHTVRVIKKFERFSNEIQEVKANIDHQNRKIEQLSNNIDKTEKLADQILHKEKIQISNHRITPKRGSLLSNKGKRSL